MLSDLIKAGVSKIIVDTQEPERVYQFLPELDFEIVGEWNVIKGLELKTAGHKYNAAPREKSLNAAIEYLLFANRKHFVLFLNPKIENPDLISEIKQHCLVFVGPDIPHIVGAARIRLPAPSKQEYQKALKKTSDVDYCQGMLLSEAENCFKYSEYTGTSFLKNRHKFVSSRVIDFIDSHSTFKDLGGFFDFKRWFNKRKYLYKSEAKDYGLTFPKGALLAGVPGCGKSLCAATLGNESDLPLVRLDLTKVYDQFVGVSESDLRAALESIERAAPAILWIEELGRLVVGKDSQGDSGTTSRLLAILLTWLQEHGRDIFTVATVNDLENIPKELIRKGRFSEIFTVDYPDHEARKEIWKIHMEKRGLALSYDHILEILAEKTEGKTGADIESIVEDTLIHCYSMGIKKEHIVGNHFEQIIGG
jgi:SpoVK/Ycf46/Vps4 family AAA+-type ATPase